MGIPGVDLIRHHSGEFELAKMAVTTDYRNRGIGTDLSAAAIKRALGSGVETVYLRTHPKLAEYSGTYGTRLFAVDDDDVLLYQRDEQSVFQMSPMSNDLFRFEAYDAMRFQFARDGEGIVDRLITLFADGTRSVQQRSEQLPFPER
jgi:hypothetical protein